ncbi:hypothetical protein [Nocardia wallacei]|uniref:hypothetical protein n=1 Tax=Nocardia wallacei TaxID=480035 RepID=UPI002456A538|nr:hypothetical protein [Nocardia wallacei]
MPGRLEDRPIATKRGTPAAGRPVSRARARTVEGRQVTYELTALGHSILVPLEAICAWARDHWEELLDVADPMPGERAAVGA